MTKILTEYIQTAFVMVRIFNNGHLILDISDFRFLTKLFHFKFKIKFNFFYLVHYCYSGLLNLNVEVILLDSEGLFITNQENGNCNLDYQK